MNTRKNNFKLALGLIIALSTIFTSCDPNDNNEPVDSGTGSGILNSLDFGASIQRDFMGRVVDESNLPLDNVMISIGSKIATTDANGMFIIKETNVNVRNAFITAKKSGYLKGIRSQVPTQNMNIINIMLIQENIVGTVASGVVSEVNLSNGTKVKFDGEFKDENGNAYLGNVDVIMYHLDPSNPDIDAIMPGSLQGQNKNGEERVLESFGMLNVELKGASGQKLNIADGHVAEIEIPVDPAQLSTAPTTIPLWHFDEVEMYWVEDGEANLVGGKFIGEVSHFSWWNCDVQFPTVTLCLNVVDSTNIPLSNVKIELLRNNATYPRVGFSNGNGEICGLIPTNETLTLKAFDQCGVEIFNTTIGPFATDTNYGNIVLAGVLTEVITGNLVNCSNANVTNGYVNLVYGSENATVTVTNGTFKMSVIKCASINTFTLEGIDYDTFQSTTALPFNFSNTILGNIIACSAVTEYISVQVDNDPVTYFLNNLYAGPNGSTNGSFTIATQSTNNSISIHGNTTALGTYTSADFSFQALNINMDFNRPDTLQYTLSNYGGVGNYVDIVISGTFTDTSGSIKNLSITTHVIIVN